MKRITRHVSYANVVATLALVLALSGGAVAATGGFTSGGTLRACVNQEGGLRLLKSGKKCKKGQSVIGWNQAGPKGLAGVQGPAGPAGAPGAAGAPAAPGASSVTLWAEVDASGHVVASSGVTNVTGNAEGRFFTFNRDISKCGVSATLNEGPASVVYVERNEFPNQLVTKTDVENEQVAAGGVDLVVNC
jgi:hypothetical protein